MAMGGGRGMVSVPSSHSSSPQLCMPDEDDLESVPLPRPSILILCEEESGGTLYYNSIKNNHSAMYIQSSCLH